MGWDTLLLLRLSFKFCVASRTRLWTNQNLPIKFGATSTSVFYQVFSELKFSKNTKTKRRGYLLSTFRGICIPFCFYCWKTQPIRLCLRKSDAICPSNINFAAEVIYLECFTLGIDSTGALTMTLKCLSLTSVWIRLHSGSLFGLPAPYPPPGAFTRPLPDSWGLPDS